MLSIRMQRRGRKGFATYRIVVQDSRQTPTSGKVVAQLGSYDPHSKVVNLDKEKAQFYLDHGAQPTQRVVALLKQEKVKLPMWVKDSTKKERSIKNPEKLRKNRPAEEAQESKEETSSNEDDSQDQKESTEYTSAEEATTDSKKPEEPESSDENGVSADAK